MDLRYRSLDHIPIGGMSWVKIRLPNTTHLVILSIEIIDFLWVNNFDHQYLPTMILPTMYLDILDVIFFLIP